MPPPRLLQVQQYRPYHAKARHAYMSYPCSALHMQQRHLLDERPQLPARRGVPRQQAVQAGPQVALGGQHVARAALQPLHVVHSLTGGVAWQGPDGQAWDFTLKGVVLDTGKLRSAGLHVT